MAKIKFIYFDIGNILVDWTNAFKTVSKKFHIPFSKIAINEWNKYDDEITRGKITPQEFWNKVRQDLKVKDGGDLDFLENWIGDYKPIKETHKLLKTLEKNYKVGLITNLYIGMFQKLLEKKLIPKAKYSAIVISCETGFRKPEKEIYNIATEKSGVKPEEILLIDDRKDFVEGAKKMGWQTFLFNTKNLKISVKKLSSKLLD